MLARFVDVVMWSGQGCFGGGVRLGVVKEVEVRSRRDISFILLATGIFLSVLFRASVDSVEWKCWGVWYDSAFDFDDEVQNVGVKVRMRLFRSNSRVLRRLG
jgi:hypothetical protein